VANSALFPFTSFLERFSWSSADLLFCLGDLSVGLAFNMAPLAWLSFEAPVQVVPTPNSSLECFVAFRARFAVESDGSPSCDAAATPRAQGHVWTGAELEALGVGGDEKIFGAASTRAQVQVGGAGVEDVAAPKDTDGEGVAAEPNRPRFTEFCDAGEEENNVVAWAGTWFATPAGGFDVVTTHVTPRSFVDGLVAGPLLNIAAVAFVWLKSIFLALVSCPNFAAASGSLGQRSGWTFREAFLNAVVISCSVA
jgi:hypothetical protein